ncbi:hypothetical protein Tfer_0877 [Thermincola ferriacetica]|uniref:Uncharacterized protein n=1 Tax=Thermincola ferriacetica TaxID=281456 RepID=A0A0L6W410_9FIRM|nr:hypothetical protein [Thermincola ferriacetica]KNZ70317.1 hypothetical protein Tfer_0877 [Thermincola ferriacetica]
MFGHESKPCRVYEYGCLTPTAGEKEMLDQLHRRNQFWNRLVEIEREYRQAVNDLLTPPDNPVPELEAELEAVREEIKQRRQQKRSVRVNISDLRERAKDLRERIRQARQEARAARKEMLEANRDKLKELDAERVKQIKQAQAESGLYWCNYDEVVASYQVARQKAARQGRDLRFHRFDGSGKVTVRWQKGLPVEQVFGSDTRLQIDPVSEEAWYHPKRSERRRLSRTKVRIRVASDGRNPVWLELPMVMHRPLPPDGTIRSASIVREKLGNTYRYKLVVTVALETPSAPVIPAASGRIFVNCTWQRNENGIVAATWHDDSGQKGELILPNRVVSQFYKLDDLRSIRDKHFNEIKETISKFLDMFPDWLKEELATIDKWRSQARLVSVYRKWRENRFDGDEEMFEAVGYWYMREQHLWLWEVNLRDQLIRHRREIYRIFSAGIAKKYAEVVVSKPDLRKAAEKPDPEFGPQTSKPEDRIRTIAAVSTLYLAIENACRKFGRTFANTPAS